MKLCLSTQPRPNSASMSPPAPVSPGESHRRGMGMQISTFKGWGHLTRGRDTVGFPTTLSHSVVAFDRPDQCDGC
jgi:hypothetical protein